MFLLRVYLPVVAQMMETILRERIFISPQGQVAQGRAVYGTKRGQCWGQNCLNKTSLVTVMAVEWAIPRLS